MNPLCIRYLGGILVLPGFWSNMDSVHSHIARKLFSRMVHVLKDIGIGSLTLGPADESEPRFDYEGVDLLATTILNGVVNWFGRLAPDDWAQQPWFEAFREFLGLLRM